MIDCSYCKEHIYNEDETVYVHKECKGVLDLTHQEVIDLYQYFYKRAGFISRETDEPIHHLYNRLLNYVRRFESNGK